MHFVTETFGRKRNVALRLTTILEIAHESKEKKNEISPTNTYPAVSRLIYIQE